MGTLSIWDRVTRSFDSGLDYVWFGLIVGAALVFFVYLLADGFYHRQKWRRLQRKCREAGEVYADQQIVPEDRIKSPRGADSR